MHFSPFSTKGMHDRSNVNIDIRFKHLATIAIWLLLERETKSPNLTPAARVTEQIFRICIVFGQVSLGSV